MLVRSKASPSSQTASEFQGSGFSIYRPWVDKRSNGCNAWVFQYTVSLNKLFLLPDPQQPNLPVLNSVCYQNVMFNHREEMKDAPYELSRAKW